jgi:hypothetical protein
VYISTISSHPQLYPKFFSSLLYNGVVPVKLPL